MPKKSTALKYYQAIGRRKSATASIRLHLATKEKEITFGDKKVKKGEIYVNGQPIDKYFSGESNKVEYLTPLKLTDNLDRFAITVKVVGGGKAGQLDAIVLGISRALEKVDKATYRPILKKQGLLTRDARIRERRKVGMGGKARRKKQSPKR
ncbi:30S ribosomal protein S9 [Candidatus Roizmanbacteria bacterium RIFCSPHIGHO2_02_FULL_37_13b]|uniref:30S ribosomal protein S9 n=1 Tax=Candidatus Roizmanbacteria bacterium RIFCSPLOWO2_02_FULL_36_11 TaxID=1802071 RepID=A0A1F7JCG5_9BACT|nr:MAG: 30S ribosomal protein S9 [Candidatus Roizmanbacteria bacterium RIFCSPHIGHO2_02_FULL_37_13b]OGK53306.1 MAG: 30S ribosomal protein S9 [Candidatus Roizmanbacteria bacterium RIFCSPLOWO2_02_FULL_36_11]